MNNPRIMVLCGTLVVLFAVAVGIPRQVGQQARADDEEPPGPVEVVIVIGERPDDRVDLETRLAVEEWLNDAQGKILAEMQNDSTFVVELCDDGGDGDCATTFLSILVDAVEEDVNEKNDCIRKFMFTKTQRDKVDPHVVDYRMGVGPRPEAEYDDHGDDDPATGTYITVLDPVAVHTGSNSLLRDWLIHENVHHITFDPATGTGTAHHPPRGFWDKHDELRAQRWCRG